MSLFGLTILTILLCYISFAGWRLSVKNIKDNERGVVFKLGKFSRVVGPGKCKIQPFLEVCRCINLDEKLTGWKGMTEKKIIEEVTLIAKNYVHAE